MDYPNEFEAFEKQLKDMLPDAARETQMRIIQALCLLDLAETLQEMRSAVEEIRDCASYMINNGDHHK